MKPRVEGTQETFGLLCEKRKNRNPEIHYLHWDRKLAYLASCDLQMCAEHIIPAEVVDFSEGLVNEYK